MISVYPVRREGDSILLDPRPLPPGTESEPVILEDVA